MITKTTETSQHPQSAREAQRLFTFMHVIAWISLGVGVLMSLWNVGHFSDRNLTLMLGIGFMVGSVFIYTIGTAIHLVHKMKYEQHAYDELAE